MIMVAHNSEFRSVLKCRADNNVNMMQLLQCGLGVSGPRAHYTAYKR